MSTDRKTLIADAAIDLLGQLGARGLTHRAVDAQAGLPPGSTSFYCRSRLDLLTLALQRHAALDLADLQADAQRMARGPLTLPGLLDVLTDRLSDWLSPVKRPRLVARFELFLMASREPELARIVGQQRAFFLKATEAALAQVGTDPSLAPTLLALVDGLLLGQVGTNAPVLSQVMQQAVFQSVLGDAVKTTA